MKSLKVLLQPLQQNYAFQLKKSYENYNQQQNLPKIALFMIWDNKKNDSIKITAVTPNWYVNPAYPISFENQDSIWSEFEKKQGESIIQIWQQHLYQYSNKQTILILW